MLPTVSKKTFSLRTNNHETLCESPPILHSSPLVEPILVCMTVLLDRSFSLIEISIVVSVTIVMGQKEGYGGTVDQNSIDTFLLSARSTNHDAHSCLILSCHRLVRRTMMHIPSYQP